MTAPRIYVACLASYNNGVLHGRWIELDGLDYDDVQAEIAEMLRESPEPNVTVKCPECGGDGDGGLAASCVSNERKACPMCGGTGKVPSAEEWAVHDSEDLPTSFRDTEHPDLAALVERLQELEDLSDDEREAFDAFCEVEGEEDVDTFRERYIGEFNSWAEMAEHHADETALLEDVPENLRRYFDYESYGRDMRTGGEAYESRGHYFWSH
ncbi:antirestriction protein ArdA [Xanthomonas citri pv. citri]|uniref:Antirestriction protein n=6 Tax=Xanthomonas TaxID=338 RepID=A0AAI8ERM1_XANAC|nr:MULTISPECIES: antirestriction protein ArdA [Xanthomonas]AAM35939.1 antirestriction protein [Xanthomonas citri pv. citri str. 306]AGH76587.1 antirestriction protein [Xanthomonas axonopodis Xac29-1]AJD67645.1 antirestriction protein [Xanthomonas citri subsp. citri A306]AJY81179.1 Antirestriction protein [Xanthomonas citri pv. citri]AJY85601.1 Antirestriction protein [Xanthomonas citri subsp. citri UI6]